MFRTFLRAASVATLTWGLLASCQNPAVNLASQASGTASLSRAVSVPAASTPAFAQASAEALAWLRSQQDQTGTGLVDSLEDFSAPNTPIPVSYTYDQAVAAIAFVLAGDLTRAQLVLDTMKAIQAADGSWVNSYWNNSTGYWGEELRKHVGPVAWMAMAVMTYENVTGDTVTYRNMALKALDWCVTFAVSNGALSGGMTTWFTSPEGSWQPEVWSSTEQNLDAYAALRYFAAAVPAKAAGYNAVADNIKTFLDTVVWDSSKNRFRGGFKNNTNLVDPSVPMDVNPWAVQALGTLGTHDYGATLDYVENANANPGTTPDNPRYVHNLPYGSGSINLYDFDWRSDGAAADSASGGGVLGADIWFEGSAFMSVSHRMRGNAAKADAILTEIIKKQGKDGSKTGGVPYSLNATNNGYWKMTNVNCISSTGWLIIALHQWNPFTALPVGTTVPQVAAPAFSPAGGTYSSAQTVTLTSTTSGAAIRYTTDGSTPTSSSTLYTGPLSVQTSQTVKAYASKSGMTDSSVTTASYTISSITQVAAPTFSPAGGTYTSAQTVTLTSTTSGAAIRYTTDGSTPTSSSALYTGPLSVQTSQTVKAYASKSGMTDSSVTTASYTIQAATDFTHSASASGTSLGFTFVSNVSSAWVDVHYFTSKNGGQQNFRMTRSGNTWTQAATTSPALVSGDTVTYWFTYEKAALAYDSSRFIHTVGGTVTVPTAPTALVVTSGNQSLSLNWADNATNETSYLVYISTASTQPASPTATLAAGTTTYQASGLTNGTSYQIWVSASNSAGNSASATGSGTPAATTVQPLVLDNFNSAARWNSGTNSLGKAVTLQGGLYNLEGDANLYFFYNGGAAAQGFTQTIGQSLSGYTKLILVVKGQAGGEQTSLSVILTDASSHTVSLAGYGPVTTAYSAVTVPLSAFGANLAAASTLKVVGTGTAQTVRIDEIRFE